MRAILAHGALVALCSAHFDLTLPAARGKEEAQMGTFPCGAFSSPSANRTEWPLSGGPVAVDLEHTTTNVQILLALGSDPGSAFNTVLVKTFTVNGAGAFCIPDVPLPSGVAVTAGQNASIQVISNNENGGGLYSCADIVFSNSTMATPQAGGSCTNGTGVGAAAYSNPNANANTTTTNSASKTNSAAVLALNNIDVIGVVAGILAFTAVL